MAGAIFVFHLAANADVRFGTEHPRKDLEQNTIATCNVLEAMRLRRRHAHRLRVHRIGLRRGRRYPTPEDAPFPVQTSLYGASKLAAEGLIAAYCGGLRLSGVHLPLRVDSGRALHARPRVRLLPPTAANIPASCDVLGNGSSASRTCTCRTASTRFFTALEQRCRAGQYSQPGHGRVLPGQRLHRLDLRAPGLAAPRSTTPGATAAGSATARSSSWTARASGRSAGNRRSASASHDPHRTPPANIP